MKNEEFLVVVNTFVLVGGYAVIYEISKISREANVDAPSYGHR